MNRNIEVAFEFDYDMIVDEYNFYQMLPPRYQTELVNLLFSEFKEKFSHFFEGLEDGFTNEIIMHLHCRRFNDKEEIV